LRELRSSADPRPICSHAQVVEDSGFALIAVLWVVVATAAIATAANVAAREGVASARNRVDLISAFWSAENCAERARAAMSEALLNVADGSAGSPGWRRLDEVVARSPLLSVESCEVEVEAAGARLDLNAADAETVRRLLTGIVGPAAGDSLADALSDWKDEDSIPRPMGAEREWYTAAGRHPPRNAPLESLGELRRIRGWEHQLGLEELVSIEPGRIALSHASPAVLAALPGFTPEMIARAIELRSADVPIFDLQSFIAGLSPSGRTAGYRALEDLMRTAAVEPDAWILRARGRSGDPAVTQVVELRLARDDRRIAIVRRRTWIE
jgi:type II secretory pathway component PulK